MLLLKLPVLLVLPRRLNAVSARPISAVVDVVVGAVDSAEAEEADAEVAVVDAEAEEAVVEDAGQDAEVAVEDVEVAEADAEVAEVEEEEVAANVATAAANNVVVNKMTTNSMVTFKSNLRTEKSM